MLMNAPRPGLNRKDERILDGTFPRGFVLSHLGLCRQENRGPDAQNLHYFTVDLRDLKLQEYEGTFVAYQTGVFCGQYVDGDFLFREAESIHGRSSLAVFLVPESEESLDLDRAFGVY